MSTFFKNLILFILSMLLSFVLLEQFILNSIAITLCSALSASILYFFIRNKIRSFHLHQVTLIFFFITIITIPLIGKKETTSLEKRKLAEFPKFRAGNIWSFFFGFTDYFTDRLSCRNSSIELIRKVKYRLFSSSPVPDFVTVGKDDWLFHTRKPIVEETCTPLTPKQLQTIKTNLDIITKWFDQRNIKYYFTIMPSKSRIYPEMMPAMLKLQMQHASYIQLLDYLKNDSIIRLIDCTQELINGKKVRPIYYKTDTHWNKYGAFLGYRKIIERVRQDFPQIVPFELTDFTLDSSVNREGDLELMMGFKNFINSPFYELKFKKDVEPIANDEKKLNYEFKKYYSFVMPYKVNGLKLFMIRDSFTEYLRYYFTRNFDQSSYYWSPEVPAMKVVNEKPDIVIHEMLELFILHTLELPADIKSDTVFLKHYFQEYEN